MAAVLLLIAGGAALVAAAVHTPAVSPPGYAEAVVVAERPVSLDPLVDSVDPAVGDLGALLYRGLMRLNGQGYPVVDLASSVSVSGNGLSYSVHLAHAADWSNGDPITASDVVTTVAEIHADRTGDAALAQSWSGVSAHIQAVNTIVFSLSRPRASFPALLAQTPILPFASAAQAVSLMSAPAQPMPTSGSYRVVGSSAAAVVLGPNPRAEVAPHLRQVELRLYSGFPAALQALRRGAVDGLLATTPQERAQLGRLPGLRLHSLLTFQFADLLFNQANAVLADPVVRTAVADAVDRSALVSGPLQGAAVPMTGAIPAGIEWLQGADPPVTSDIDAGEAALTADGYVPSAGGVRQRGSVRLMFTLSVADVAPFPAVAAAVARQLAPEGIDLSLSLVAPQLFLPGVLETGDYQLALADWNSGPDPDISGYWRSNASPPAGLNVTGAPADAFLDRDLDSLATLSSRSARAQAASRVAAEIAADAPAVFLYAPTVCLAVRATQAGVLVPATGGESARWDELAAWPAA